MALTLGMITTDTSDPTALGRWWAEQTDGEVVETNDGWFVVVQPPGGPMLAFQRVDQPAPGKNRLHLDLGAPDLDTEVERLTGVGATIVERRQMGDFRWVTMADPDGNEFCVANQ